GINSGELPLPQPCGAYTATAIYQINGTWHTCCKMISMCNPYDCSSSISHTTNASNISLSLPAGVSEVTWSSNLGISPNGSIATIPLISNGGLVHVSATYKDQMGIFKTCRKDITINNCTAPTSAFSYTNNNNAIQLTNQSTGATSYTWDFAGGVAVSGNTNTPNAEVFFLHSGNYNICLTSQNECGNKTSCQMIQVTNQQACGFNLGNNVCGSVGQEVLVPITVVNFKNIMAFNLTIKSQDGNLVQFKGCEQFHPSIATGNYFFVENNSIRFFWSDPIGKTLADDAIIFYIRVKLNNSFYQPIQLTFSNEPVKIECFNAQQIQIPVNTSNGSVCLNQTASVQGMFTTHENKPVSHVHLMVNQIDMQTNQSNGAYNLNNLSMGTSYEIKPLRNDSPYNGLNGLDIIRLQRHILQIESLDSPYKIIAADINNDRNLNAIDIINLQRIILRMITEFPNNNSWRFIPKSFAFNSTSPLLSNFPESMLYSPLNTDMSGQDFIAVKIGDLNGSADLSINENHVSKTRNETDTVFLHLKHQYISSGQYVSIPVTVKNFKEILSLENSFSWDSTSLEYQGVSDFAVSNLNLQNFGTTLVSKGLLLFSWFDTQASGISLSDNTILFKINFKLKDNFKGSSEVKVVNAPINLLCVNKNLENVTLNVSNAVITQVSPLTYTIDKQNLLCYGSTNGSISINVSGGTGNFIYEWSHGISSPNAIDLSAGSYTCKVKDALTLEEIQITEEITSPLQLKVDLIASQDSHTGDSRIDANVEGGVPPYQYKWSTGSNNSYIHQLNAGTYIVTITDNNLCVARAESEILVSATNDIVDHRIKLYPNPANNEIFIELSDVKNCNFKYVISDSNGKSIISDILSNCLSQKINISTLIPGMYQIVIKNLDETYTAKFVVIK
ncbi:MAG: hypothetical protein RLZZ546_966, partial [Bacteroidota bacterium]